MLEGIGYPDVKILLIEDDPGDTRIIKELLKDAIDFNHDLICVENLLDGLKYIEEKEFDVVLLDLTLPDSAGFETVLRTREKVKNVPIVILTGLDDDNVARKAIQAGVQDFLIKGQIDTNPLIRSIYHAIERHKMTQTIESLANALQKNEKRLRKVIDFNADGIIIVDEEGLVCFVNPAAEKLFGRNKREFIGQFFGFPTGKNDKMEIEIIQTEGGLLYAEMKISKITWEGKKANLLTLRDITERKKTEEALQKSEAGLSNAQRIAHIGNWNWDIVKNEVYWSDEIYRIFGLKPQEFGATYEAFLNSIHPDDREFVKKSVDEALYEKKPYSINHRIVLRDGSERIVSGQGEVAFDSTGKAIRMIGIIQDITKLKQSEQAVKNLEHTLQEMNALIESAPVPIFLMHQNGNILRINEEAENLFNYREEDFLNMKIFDLFEADLLKIIKRHYNNDIYDLSLPNKIEVSVKTKEGKLVDVEITSAILKIADNLIIQSFFSDISERKDHERQREILLDQLLDSLEFKSKFLAAMSHELRTPLNAILGFSQLLLEDSYGKTNEDQKEFLRDINSAGDHLLILINSILDISKIEAGKFEINIKEFNLNEILYEINSIIKPLYSKKGLNFNIEGINSTTYLNADQLKFKQVLYNLIDNAIKFTEKGSITFKAIERKDHWEFQVKDTGIGIAKKDYEVVFREFGRIENDKIKQVSGSGLGLALSKRIIKLHGGEIWFESKLDKGTVFYFTIPKVPISN